MADATMKITFTADDEVAVDNRLLAERDQLLDEFPCPLHGRCASHALETVMSMKARLAALESEP